jgi:hypothetical protein
MGNFIVRITIVFVALYFMLAYYMAQFHGVDILYNSYTLLFELCVVIFTFTSGKYHCKFMKWTALSILLVDIISHTDYYFNYIPLNYWSLLPLFILALGLGTSITLAIRHFHRVIKLNRRKNVNNARNTR